MIKKLWQEYTTATFGLDSNEDLPDFKDILKPSSEFWLREQSEPCTLSNIPWKVKVEIINPFVPDPALKRGETGWFLRIFKNSYFIARTFRLHTQVPNALEKHLK